MEYKPMVSRNKSDIQIWLKDSPLYYVAMDGMNAKYVIAETICAAIDQMLKDMGNVPICPAEVYTELGITWNHATKEQIHIACEYWKCELAKIRTAFANLPDELGENYKKQKEDFDKAFDLLKKYFIDLTI